jgi:hypothetical protein
MSGSRKSSSIVGSRLLTRGVDTPFGDDSPGWTRNLILNGGFENDLAGWTTVLGNPGTRAANPAPYDGDKYLIASLNTSLGEINQIIDLTEVVSDFTDIDAGLVTATLSWRQSSYSGNDKGRCELRFLKENGTFSGDEVLADLIATAAQVWTYRELIQTVYPETRTIRVTLRGSRLSGTANDAYFDNVALNLS